MLANTQAIVLFCNLRVIFVGSDRKGGESEHDRLPANSLP